MLSRRGLLRGVLPGVGVGAAQLSCRGDAPRVPEVSFVGQTPERGHLLREPSDLGSPAETVRAGVVIVGGGAAGAAAAWRLQRAGRRDVHVLELEDVVGGTARGGGMDRSRFPMGAHYLPSPRSDFRGLVTLLEDLDVVTGREADGALRFDTRAIVRAPMERHRHRGSWHMGLYPAQGETDAEAAQWARWLAHLRSLDRVGSDGRRLFDLPVHRSSADMRHLDRVSMAAYMDEQGFDSWRVRWLVDYACRDDYGCLLEETSAFAGLHHFLARGLEEDRDGYILSWPDGNGHLVQGMLTRAELGDRMHVGTVVRSIDPQAGRVLALDAASGAVRAFDAQVVLWAAPRFILPHVLPTGADPLRRGALPYAPWLVAGVSVDKTPRGIGAPLSWDNVAIEGAHLGYVVANHGEPLTELSRTGAVLSYYEPLRPGERGDLLAATAPELATRVMSGLEGMHPGIRGSVSAVQVARWGHGMIRPEPGLLFGSDLARARQPIGRVLPCATDTSGLALFEEAFSAGVAAAEEALERLGAPEATVL